MPVDNAAFATSAPLVGRKRHHPRLSPPHPHTAAAAAADAAPHLPIPRMAARMPKPDPASHSTLRQSGKADELPNVRPDTRVIHAGMHRDEWTTDPLGRTFVNPPVQRASTIVFPDVASLRYAATDWPFTGLWYGRHGTTTHFALEEAFAAIEGGTNAVSTASGSSACAASILAFVKQGDHVLITDAVYDPTRELCDSFLGRFGVDTTYFDPCASPAEVERLVRPNTVLVFLESPASLSFDVQDVPAIAAMARARRLKVLIDNTWGPGIFKPLALGAHVSINAATKYIGGHSDLMLGLIAAAEDDDYRAVRKSVVSLGCPPGADEAYLALRGLRTLSVRMERHGKNGLTIARWLEARPEVVRVMHPGLESHPQHELFAKQFSGCSGLFGFQLRDDFSQRAVDAMLDGMRLHAMGFSWGGFESLLTPNNINSYRSATKWKYGDGYGKTMRIHAGLEDVDDLIRDLDDGFQRLNIINQNDKET